MEERFFHDQHSGGLAPVQKPSNNYIKLKIGENWEGGIGAIFREGGFGDTVPTRVQRPFQNRLKIQDLSPAESSLEYLGIFPNPYSNIL